MNRAVFFDRDGVVNKALPGGSLCGKAPHSLDVLEIFPDTHIALNKLHRAGFKLIVVTNQPDVPRGRITRKNAEDINRYILNNLPLDAIEVCFHDDCDQCDCRKPKSGMLLSSSERYGIDLSQSYMVGDRWRDIDAGNKVDCTTILVGDGYGEKFNTHPDIAVSSIAEAADWILKREKMNKTSGEMKSISDLKVQIFADGADRAGILEMYGKPYIKGFTTNPTLMKKAGIADYRAFALDILKSVPDRPISFEVFSDDFQEMERQALDISSWGENVNVKIPVTNTHGDVSYELIHKLSSSGVPLNVTAIMTLNQIRDVVANIKGGAPCYVSVFAGRIADTGFDPVPLMRDAVGIVDTVQNARLIWASPRELLNIFQADDIGCHVITVTNDILKKLKLVGKDLSEFSLDTVRMFYNDAQSAGYSL